MRQQRLYCETQAVGYNYSRTAKSADEMSRKEVIHKVPLTLAEEPVELLIAMCMLRLIYLKMKECVLKIADHH